MPGWSGLSNARVTIFGDVVPLPADLQVCTKTATCSLIPYDALISLLATLLYLGCV